MIICETKKRSFGYMSNRFGESYVVVIRAIFDVLPEKISRLILLSMTFCSEFYFFVLTYLQALKLLNSHDDDDFKLRIIAIPSRARAHVVANWIYDSDDDRQLLRMMIGTTTSRAAEETRLQHPASEWGGKKRML